MLSRLNYRVYVCQLYFSGILMNNGLSAHNAGDPRLIPGLGRSTGEGIGYPFQYSWASLVAQLIKNLPTMQETWVWSLGWEDPLRGERLPTSVFWPGEFHGLYSPWGGKELDTTEQLSLYVFWANELSYVVVFVSIEKKDSPWFSTSRIYNNHDNYLILFLFSVSQAKIWLGGFFLKYVY